MKSDRTQDDAAPRMTKQEWRISCQNRYSSGTWFQIPNDFMWIMDWDCAILLAFLINFARLVRAEEDSDGWFWCTIETIHRKLGCNGTRQKRLLKKLEDTHLIKRKRAQKGKGKHPIRHIYIRYTILDKLAKELHLKNIERFGKDYRKESL